MLAPLAANADTFLVGAHVLFEVACRGGVPDATLIDIDQAVLTARVGTSYLEHPSDVRVMLELQASPAAPIPLPALASAVKLTVGHVRRAVLPRLAAGGHVDVTADGVAARYAFRSLARRVVTVEAKLRDWRSGLAQSARYAASADEVWLVLDARHCRAAVEHADWFTLYGVAVAGLDAAGGLVRHVAPGVNRSQQPQRELLVERAVALLEAGGVSGPLPRVFGQVLTATAADPRLRGAAAGCPR
jgi:hypothetical protein